MEKPEDGTKPDTPKRDGMKAAKALILKGGTATLGVLDVKSAAPFATLVNFATDAAGAPVLLTSALAHHTQCLKQDQRASLLVHAELPAEGDPLTGLRVTLTGRFEPVDDPAIRAAFLARHPYADLYAGFADFGFWRMVPERAHIIAGFGRAYAVGFADLMAG